MLFQADASSGFTSRCASIAWRDSSNEDIGTMIPSKGVQKKVKLMARLQPITIKA